MDETEPRWEQSLRRRLRRDGRARWHGAPDRRRQGVTGDAGPLPAFDEPVGVAEFFQASSALRTRRTGSPGGRHWRLHWPIRSLPVPSDLGQALCRTIQGFGGARTPALHPDLRPLTKAAAEDLLFFDLETLGLGSAGVFLIGILTVSGEEVVVEQMFAEDYSEEGAIIEAFGSPLGRKRILVSFNGKAFDMPLLSGRAGLWKVPLPSGFHHLDMLYECRRRWSGRLPDCRLQTLEEFICGRRRTGDIPGAQIPEVYHRYVRSGDARLIGPILLHNALDLVAMAEVLLACLAG